MVGQEPNPEPKPAEELTNAFNALFVEASIHLDAGTEKLMFMNRLRDERQNLTTYNTEPLNNENAYSKFQPYTLQFIVANDGSPFDLDLSPIFAEAETLLELHRLKCAHVWITADGQEVSSIIGGRCMCCGVDEDTIKERQQIATEAKFEGDFITGQKCVCSDCGSRDANLWIEDESTRLEGHSGLWADCEECGTITGTEGAICEGANCNEINENYDPAFANYCRAECAEEPEEEACCDLHAMCENAEHLPCAMYQGDEFIPEFAEGDFENELFKSHIQHLIDTEQGGDILAILRRWEVIKCPSCGENVEFIEEGAEVLVTCHECEVGARLDYVFP